MININDKRFEEKEVKAIFNGGKAGVARNCPAKITKRGADENPNGPMYKLVFQDESKALIDRPFFKPNEDMTEKQSSFFVKEMKHLMTQTNTKWNKDDFSSYLEMMEYVIGAIKDTVSDKKYGVAVSYGTINKPSQYLNVDGFWGFRSEDNITDDKPLDLSKNALLNRIEPKGPGVVPSDFKSTDGADSLPF